MWNGDRTAKIRAGGIERLPVPGVDPASSPLQTIQFNQSWVAYVLGILPAMLHPAYWATSDPDVLANVQCQVQELLNLIAVGATILPPFCDEQEDAMADYVPIVGLPGTDESSRIVGTVAGAPPSSGNFLLNDIAPDRDGGWWRCIAGGSPGIWRGYGVGAAPVVTSPVVRWPGGSTSDWVASNGTTPPGYVFDAGLVVAYPGNGYARISWPNDMTARKIVAPLPGATEFDVVLHIKPVGNTGAPVMKIGFSAVGDTTDLDGVQISSQGDMRSIVAGTVAGTADIGWQFYGSGFPFVWLWLRLAAGTLDVFNSVDGVIYTQCVHGADALVATKFVMSIVGEVETNVITQALWLDYIAFGNSTLPGQ